MESVDMRPSNRKPKIIFLTGAGLSADSGMKTFRGAGGLYSGMSGEKLMSRETLARHPELIHGFCDDLRVAMEHVKPNPAHEMITRVRKQYGAQVLHLTQNFDDLCEKAGDQEVVHLHGELRKMRAPHNTKNIVDIGYTRYWDGDPITPLGTQFRCKQSGKHFRPDVILFGEGAPRYKKFWTTFKYARRDDLVIVIGTQGNVLPVEQACWMAPGPKILVNLHDSEHINPLLFRHCFFDSAAAVADKVETLIHEHYDAIMAKRPS
jgi:NAD-dependent deacetylase